MRHIRRDDLQHDRTAEPVGACHRLVDVLGQFLAGHRDPVRLGDDPPLGRGERLAPGGPDGVEQLPYPFTILWSGYDSDDSVRLQQLQFLVAEDQFTDVHLFVVLTQQR